MFDYEKYLRMDYMPHIWCSGCGDGIVLKSLIRAIDKCQLDKNNVVMVSGIGCSSRTPGYVDFNTLHTTHGRAIPFATGVKLAKPHLDVIVITGDGDGCAIGGNHFIHAARRNIDITVILYNNNTYGMTGGQISPTSRRGDWGTTAPYGNPEPAFDIAGLAIAAGASFVARSTTYHAVQLAKLIEQAIKKKGFSLVEVYTQCPTYNRSGGKRVSATAMLDIYKEASVPVAKAKNMSEEELEGKIVTGVLVDRDMPEYCEEYQKLIERVQAKAKATAAS
jgi:2-oxoglutarate ferredoxin oxidoreductase subunit beta